MSLTQKVFTNPIHFCAFGFGAGLLPKAPGTWGTLIAIPIWYWMLNLNLNGYLAVTVGLTLLGIGICHYSAKKLGVHDHPGIVWDEICGFLITMIGAPIGIVWCIIGFVLFRLFDIIKPWPIRWLDKKVSGGIGIMLDDIVAGAFAWGVIYLIRTFFF